MKDFLFEYRWPIYVDTVIYIIMIVKCVYETAKEDHETSGFSWFYQIRMEFKNAMLRTIWKYFVIPFVVLD